MKQIFGYIWQYFRKLDKMLFAAAAALSAFSVILLYSLYVNDAVTINIGSGIYQNQIVAVMAGWFIALVLSAMDYRNIIKLWVLYTPLAVVLMLLTFTSLGYNVESTGDRAWIDFGFFTIQPSELLKITFITTFSLHLSKVGDRINNFINVILLCIHAAIPAVLVVIQGDEGTACVFIMIFVIMIFSAGISWKYILPCLIMLPVAVYLVWTRFMETHHKMRFLVLFDEELDPMGIGYHQRISKIALGSGQIFGKGLFGGEYLAIPEAANDFIFTYVGQTCGFIGCIGVVAVLSYICMKILADSRIAKDDLGRHICVGVYAMIFIHCLLNLGMVLGALPVIGVPLPFLSQGGTSVISLYIGIGLVMSTYSHSEKKYRVFYDGTG